MGSIDVDALKASVDLIGLVGSYTPLRKRGKEYVGLCVNHADKNPSMYVYQRDGKWLVHCHSCDFHADAIDFIQHVEGLDFKAACERLGANVQWKPTIRAPTVKPLPDRITSKPPAGINTPSFNLRSLGEPVLTFPIKDIDGSIIAYECRYETTDDDGAPKKVPLIWSWGAREAQPASWGLGALTAPRALYGLHRIGERGGAPICLTEGPKKADSASRLLPQYNCLSITGGAEAWEKHDYAHLAGLSVLLIPDADEPGWRNFCKLAAHLTQSERPPSKVRIVDTLKQPNRPPKGWDVADAEAEEWTGDDFQKWCRVRADDYNLAYHDPQRYSERAPQEPVKPVVAAPTAPAKPYADGHDVLEQVKYRAMSQVTARSINWLWPGRIARGKLSIVVGNPGLGKSQVCASLSSVVSNGGIWPVDRTKADRGSVVILSAEDDPEDTIRPRLEAAGADLDKVYILEAIRYQTDKGEPAHRGFNLGQDIGRLGALLHELGDAALVIIDPVTAYLGDADSHKNAEVRALLAPLQEMAAHQGAAVIAVSHLTKSAGMDALLRVQGSIGFAAAARAVWGVAKDKDNAQRRLFMPLKNNLGTDNSGFAYMVEGFKLPESDIQTSHVMWENELITASAEDVFGQQDNGGQDRHKLNDAKDFLRDLLRDGPVLHSQVKRDCDGAGHKWQTVERAKDEMRITSFKDGFKSPWKWRLP